MLSTQNPGIRDAVMRVKELSEDEAARMIAEKRLDTQRILRGLYQDALKGREQQEQAQKDIEQARKDSEQARLETARRALAKGLSVEDVSDVTGLDVETIRSLTL